MKLNERAIEMLYEKLCDIEDYIVHIIKLKFSWFSLRARVENIAMAEEAIWLQRQTASNLESRREIIIKHC